MKSFLHGWHNNDWKPVRTDNSGNLRIVLTNNADPLPTDEITQALVIIDTVHYEIHEGDLFSVNYKSPDDSPIADNGTIIFALTTHNDYVHMQAFGAVGGDGEIELREDATVSAGSATTPLNHKRYVAHASTVTVVRDPTMNTQGTLLENIFLPGGTGGNAIGSEGTQRNEWILKPNSIYIVRLTNRSGSAQPASLAVVWYEETTA